jgi:hypothetical protein
MIALAYRLPLCHDWQRHHITGLLYPPYLESCPRTAPFGKAALWTLT